MTEAIALVSLAIGTGVGAAPILAAIITAAYQFLAGVLRWIFSWVVVSKQLADAEGRDALLHHLAQRSMNAGVERYFIREMFVKPLRERRSVWGLASAVTWRVFAYKGAPVLFRPSGDGPGCPSLFYLRGTLDFRALLQHVENQMAEYRKGRAEKRFQVIRYTGSGQSNRLQRAESYPSSTYGSNAPTEAPKAPGSGIYDNFAPVSWNHDDLGLDTEGGRLDDLHLTQDMQDLVKDASFWHSHREWYQDRGIAWRRGYMLHGRPGTGKTSIVRALGEHLDLPILVFDLTGMSNDDFLRSWAQGRNWSPRIVLLEDIDSVFDGRTPVHENTSMTFDTLLNVFDGIERDGGLLLFVTTNHIEKVDPALGAPAGAGTSSRPGRIDRTIEFGPIGHDGRFKIAKRILRDESMAVQMAADGANDTPAQLQERCIREALKQLWGDDADAMRGT